MELLETLIWLLPLSIFMNMVVFSLAIFLFRKTMIKVMWIPMIKRIMEDDYHENLLELFTAIRRTGIQKVLENSLRAEKGEIIKRPMGSPLTLPNFESLVFRPAQVFSFPTSQDQPIDMKVKIGPMAKKPLILDIPIAIGAMGYGVGVSYNLKMAIAKAAAQVGTAVNSGEGPFLKEERENAKYYIFQYSATKWADNPEAFQTADAIEIHIGQGASAGMGNRVPYKVFSEKTKEIMKLGRFEDAVIHDTFFPNQTFADLQKLMGKLRKQTNGIPIGAKISASTEIEKDLECLIQLGVDFVTIDGSQASTKGAAPILEDDFGIPSIYALVRAVRYFKKRKVFKKISILVSGGFNVPGDFMKAIALGADAVYIGSAMLFAVTYTQITKAMPWEPPTQLVLYIGSHEEQFNVEDGAKFGANYLKSCVLEMEEGIRALGKKALSEVVKEDLSCNDPLMAKVCGVPFTGDPMDA